ncbi:MAG: hypothetical protein KDE45_14355 [Caldilineaceae bacterium]|nr:hypothetical protein [Caldilineaceae bacterium]
MALTATQLADFQADLGIDDSEAVFSDAELERLFTRASEDYPTAVYYAWRQLLAASTKYIDYRVAQTEEKRSQAYQHIKDMVSYWKGESEDSTNTRGVAIAGINPIPTKWKEAPYEAESGYRRLRRRRPGGL